MGKIFAVDLHVHTVLSPCAAVEMLPNLIVRRALDAGLAMIAITDHNSGENAGAVIEAAAGSGLTVLPGMEVTSREEIHFLTLFGSLAALYLWQDLVYDRLPPLKNNPDYFGPQFVVRADGEYIYTNDRLLSAATSFSVEEIVRRVDSLGGIVIPAHVNRRTFSLFSQLGFIPSGIRFPALEISRAEEPAAWRRVRPEAAEYPLLTASDAHLLADLGPHFSVEMVEPTWPELLLALYGLQGRKILPPWGVPEVRSS